MMASSFSVAFLVVFLVTIQGSLSCRYFCRDPVKGVYHCCDDGNPYATTPSKGDEDGSVSAGGSQGTEANPGDAGIATADTVVEHGPKDGAKYNESSRCRYYCAYGNNVYCCDDGTLKMPEDHDANKGRCPSLIEQVCKDDTIYLARKARKMEKTKSGSDFLSKIGDGEVLCASDGYCAVDERCCTTACHKRHVCVKSVVMDKTKN